MLALGWEEGRNLQIDWVVLGDADADRSVAMAAELVGRGVDANYAVGGENELRSAAAATKTIPIVFLANDYDPLAGGYVLSLARPGGQCHRCFFAAGRVDREAAATSDPDGPRLARVVTLWDRISADQLEIARDAARSLKIRLDGIECTDPPYDYERLLAGVDGAHRDVLLQLNSGLFFRDRQRFSAVALDHRLPSMFPFRQWVDEGGLMSYSASLRAPSPPIYRSSNRPGSNWSLT
jgi:putative ABC transport system substrate-binding protein